MSAAAEQWCLGAVSPLKVIHRRSCSSARQDYLWAREFPTVTDLARVLVANGSHRWHHYCQRCCGDLDDAVQAEVVAAVRRIPLTR